jgi:pyridoxal biosynthesis lyase PdxS
MEAGCSGVSVGRSVFQYKKPGNMIKAISQIVHKGFTVATAAEALKEDPIESSIFSGTVIW